MNPAHHSQSKVATQKPKPIYKPTRLNQSLILKTKFQSLTRQDLIGHKPPFSRENDNNRLYMGHRSSQAGMVEKVAPL